MRVLLNRFKEPIYKDDLINVLLYGLLNSIVFSMLSGAVQFFLNVYLRLEFGILVYLIAYMIGKITSAKVFNKHILYSIILELFFILGLFVYSVTWYSFVFHDVLFGFLYVFSGTGIINAVFPYLNIYTYQGINILYNIIDLAIVICSMITIWRFMNKN